MIIFLQLLVFILIAVGVVFYFLRGDSLKSEPISALWMAAGFGILAVIIAIILNRPLIPIMSSDATLLKILAACFGIGVIEEVSKFALLAVVIFKKPYFNEYRDGILYFSICGLTFGMIENMLYTLEYGQNAGFLRLLMTPVLHGALTGIVGYYLAEAKMRRKSPFITIVPLAVIISAHAFYNFGLSSQILSFTLMSMLVSAMLAVGLFLYFLHAKTLDHVLVPQLPVMAKSFCSHCGKPNPSHVLYCQQCGYK